MKTRNSLAAIIGLWFAVSPWILGFSYLPGVFWTCLVFGFVQLASSILALKQSKWNVLQNWLSLVTGIWFAIFPLNFSFSFSDTWTISIFGILTVIINLWNMDSTM
jgi:hypothetical protein